MKTVLALSHSNNTIEKTIFLEERYGHIGRSVHETQLKLSDFINKSLESDVYSFYDSLSYEYTTNEYTQEVITKMEKNVNDAIVKYKEITMQRMIQDLSTARTMYEKEMYFIHNKNVGRLAIKQG